MVRHARMRGHPTLWLPGPRSRLDRRAVRPRQDHRGGRRDARVARAGALPRADVASSSTTTREVMLGQQRRLGASADWGRLRFTMDEGSARAVRVELQAPLRRRSRVPDRGAHQLVPGLPDQRLRPGGHPDARDGHAVDDPLPPHRRGDGFARSGRLDRGRDDAPGDDPRRHGGGGPSGRRPLPGAGGPDGAHPVRRARRADHRGRGRRPRVRDRRREDHARPTTGTTTPPGAATACR